MTFEKIDLITDEIIAGLEDKQLANLYILLRKKKFSSLIQFIQSSSYNSNFLLLPNKSYVLMLYIIFQGIEQYIFYLYAYKDPNKLEKLAHFREIFNWFFNNKEEDYIANFSFICRCTRLRRQTILSFLINLTRNHFSENKKTEEIL